MQIGDIEPEISDRRLVSALKQETKGEGKCGRGLFRGPNVLGKRRCVLKSRQY